MAGGFHTVFGANFRRVVRPAVRQSPPAGATEADVRRLGFALGQWGGLPTVEALARRRNGGDPALQGALLGALTTRSF